MPRANKTSGHGFITRGNGYAAWNVHIVRNGVLFRRTFLDATYAAGDTTDSQTWETARQVSLAEAIKWRDQTLADCDAKGWFRVGNTEGEEGNAAWRALSPKPRRRTISQMERWIR